ncbi:MAG: MgtC/SapB family protein [Bradyrhizobium sp.]|nr:MgtC/SapB family protein [Bradyrhizobium sp.]
MNLDSAVARIGVALGIGLLVGLERERRKGEGAKRGPAGLRTFALASLAGAIASIVGGETMLALITAGIIGLTAIAYYRSSSDDPGLTSEVALVLTALLGGLAIQRPGLAAGVAVALTVLLAARTKLHDFVRSVLTEDEVRDGLIFASATLVVLPLLPDRPVGPYDAFNPRAVWIIVILVMAIGAAGHMAIRLLGAQAGLPIAGLASGFVSSTATIGAMGARATKTPALLGPAVAGGVLSTVATVGQMAVVLAAVSIPVLKAMLLPLIGGGMAAVAYGAIFTIKSARETSDAELKPGRAFSPPAALLLAAVLSGVLLLSAALQDTFGELGLVIGAAVAGLADTHAPAVAIAAVAASGKIDAAAAAVPILVAMSANTLSKAVVAWMSGGPSYALRLIPGLLAVIAAVWAGAFGAYLLK